MYPKRLCTNCKHCIIGNLKDKDNFKGDHCERDDKCPLSSNEIPLMCKGHEYIDEVINDEILNNLYRQGEKIKILHTIKFENNNFINKVGIEFNDKSIWVE
jgi:hypothetical protein